MVRITRIGKDWLVQYKDNMIVWESVIAPVPDLPVGQHYKVATQPDRSIDVASTSNNN